MALTTGFDPQVVNTSINNVKNAYEKLMNAMHDSMQREFVNGMQDKWACKEAQEVFGSVKTLLEDILTKSNTIFESVVRSMNSAAQAWAETTNSEYSQQTFTARDTNIDVSGILENIGGVRGIDLESASSTAAKLPNIAQAATDALTEAQNAVNDCGFIGGSQAENLNSSLQTIKNGIDSAQNELTNAIKTKMDNTVASYGDLAGQVASKFAGNE